MTSSDEPHRDGSPVSCTSPDMTPAVYLTVNKPPPASPIRFMLIISNSAAAVSKYIDAHQRDPHAGEDRIHFQSCKFPDVAGSGGAFRRPPPRQMRPDKRPADQQQPHQMLRHCITAATGKKYPLNFTARQLDAPGEAQPGALTIIRGSGGATACSTAFR